MPKKGLSAKKMAARIESREGNIYKQGMIKEILDMYADEIRKAILNGERVQISKVGCICPVIKTHVGSYRLPCTNRTGNDNPPPYTTVKITRNWRLRQAMNAELLKNVEKGIYGLNKLPFDIRQLNILKDSGYIPEDAEEMQVGEEE